MNIQTLTYNPFSLVLSGGGALGIAHLGVLHDLEEAHLSPSEIIGTSMGGIIGACLSIGMNEAEIYQKIKEFTAILNWFRFSFSGSAVVDTRKIERIFETIFGDKKMNETLIPLKLIATNLHTGEKRLFDSSDTLLIRQALLCTMAIPGIFEAYTIDKESYGDGFICENLGISASSFDHILAVDVLGKNAFESTMPDNFFKTSNVLEMFEKSMRLLIYNQTKTLLSQNTKEIILIEPQTKSFKTFHFQKHQEIRALGLGLLA